MDGWDKVAFVYLVLATLFVGIALILGSTMREMSAVIISFPVVALPLIISDD